jgi:anti-sigma B factor antagonist
MEPVSPAPPLAFVTRVDGSTRTLTVGGELDIAVVEHLSSELRRVLADAPELLVLDLSAVTFIDVAGVRAVRDACWRACAQSAYVTIIPGPERVQRVFGLTGLESTLPFAMASRRAGRTRSWPVASTRTRPAPLGRLRCDARRRRPAGRVR